MVGVAQPTKRTETGVSQESCKQWLQLGDFKMKVSLHESPARPTKVSFAKMRLIGAYSKTKTSF